MFLTRHHICNYESTSSYTIRYQTCEERNRTNLFQYGRIIIKMKWLFFNMNGPTISALTNLSHA